MSDYGCYQDVSLEISFLRDERFLNLSNEMIDNLNKRIEDIVWGCIKFYKGVYWEDFISIGDGFDFITSDEYDENQNPIGNYIGACFIFRVIYDYDPEFGIKDIDENKMDLELQKFADELGLQDISCDEFTFDYSIEYLDD